MGWDTAAMLFALDTTHELGKRIATQAELPLAAHEERDFEDGEHKARPLESVRDRDVYVIQSLYSDDCQSVNDKLCRLLFFIGTLRDCGAAKVTAVTPYLCYSRKDRKTKSRDPVTTRYLAGLFESVGTDRLVTVDVHNLAAFQNSFRCRTEHLEMRGLFVDHAMTLAGRAGLVVVSPDEGGIKRAEAFRLALAHRLRRPVESGFMEKRRSGGVISGERIVGEFRGCDVIIFDDLVSTGTTLLRTAHACRERGANQVVAMASHGLFTRNAAAVLADPAIDGLVVGNSVPPLRLEQSAVARKLVVLDLAPLLAECIRRLHDGRPITELTELPE